MGLNASSNYVFLVPLYLSFYFSVYWHALAIALMMLFSYLYHSHNEERYSLSDNVFALLLIAANLLLLALSGFNKVYTALAVVFVGIAFHFYFKAQEEKYELNHAMWHVSSAFITMFCLLAYGL